MIKRIKKWAEKKENELRRIVNSLDKLDYETYSNFELLTVISMFVVAIGWVNNNHEIVEAFLFVMLFFIYGTWDILKKAKKKLGLKRQNLQRINA